MPEKPIYIYLGNRGFIPRNAIRERSMILDKPDPVRGTPDARAARRFAEDEHLLRHNEECDGDMISLQEPDERMWEKLRQFIVKERGW
jgi:hypothetical protein